MAKKIRLANEKKMIQLKSLPTLQYCPPPGTSLAMENKPEDWTSIQGQFGWAEIGNTTIPYLTRCGERYVSLRMVENKIFVRYKNLFTDEVRSCFRVKIHHVTNAEAQLLNEINFRHCDNFYGRLEFSVSDGIISFKDFTEMYDFLNFCHLRLTEKITPPQSRCGFVQIAAQSSVPYVRHNGKQYVPLFYFEGECKYLEEQSTTLSGWDLAYLKLFCKIQGIRKALYDKDAVRVVEMELVKKFFPPDTTFEDTWPVDCNIYTLVQRSVPKLVFSQSHHENRQFSLEKAKPDQDSAKKSLICVEKDASMVPKKQLPVAPTTNQSEPGVVVTIVQNNLKLIQTTTKPTTHPTNSIQLLNTTNVNQHVPVSKINKVPIPRIPPPKPVTPIAMPTSNPVTPTAIPTPKPVTPTAIPTSKPVTPTPIATPKPITPTTIPTSKPVTPTAIPTSNDSNHQSPRPDDKSVPPDSSSGNFTGFTRTYTAKPFFTPDTYRRGSRILQIPEVDFRNAYFVVKAQVESKFFHCCINMEPHTTIQLLVSLEESASFFQVPLGAVINAVNVMNIDVFLPNRMQRKELEKFKVYHTRGLMKLREFIDNLPQLRYILYKSKNSD